jgi:hypothetical protein
MRVIADVRAHFEHEQVIRCSIKPRLDLLGLEFNGSITHRMYLKLRFVFFKSLFEVINHFKDIV